MTHTATGRGTFVVLEGIDGAGKTALATEVAARLADIGVVAQRSREVASAPDFARESMIGVAALLWPPDETSFDHLLGAHYWLYLQGLWYALFSRFVVEPRIREGALLVADGWYFKFYAKLRLRGFGADFLDAVFAPALDPDLVLVLDVDVEDVWRRKRFRPSELGLHAGYDILGRDSFVDYQTQVRSALLQLAEERGWTSVRVVAGEPPGETAERVAWAIREALSQPRPPVFPPPPARAEIER